MIATEFVDTNVVIYAHDISAGDKHAAAQALVARLFQERCGAISTQILIEFYSATTRKAKLPAADAESIIAGFADWTIHRPAHEDLLRSSELHRRHRISWFDALIVNSAIQLGCTTLWTEDLADGQQFGPVTVRNPFTA